MKNGFELYKQCIRQLNPKVTDEEWDYFQSAFTIQTFKPREFFIEAGKKNHQLGFVTSGLIRAYYVNDLCEDTTTTFIKEGEYATDYMSLLPKRVSRL